MRLRHDVWSLERMKKGEQEGKTKGTKRNGRKNWVARIENRKRHRSKARKERRGAGVGDILPDSLNKRRVIPRRLNIIQPARAAVERDAFKSGTFGEGRQGGAIRVEPRGRPGVEGTSGVVTRRRSFWPASQWVRAPSRIPRGRWLGASEIQRFVHSPCVYTRESVVERVLFISTPIAPCARRGRRARARARARRGRGRRERKGKEKKREKGDAERRGSSRATRSATTSRFVDNETMVCDSAGSECTAEVDEDATLKQALEELLKCMLRVWCREGQALARFGATSTGKRGVDQADHFLALRREIDENGANSRDAIARSR